MVFEVNFAEPPTFVTVRPAMAPSATAFTSATVTASMSTTLPVPAVTVVTKPSGVFAVPPVTCTDEPVPRLSLWSVTLVPPLVTIARPFRSTPLMAAATSSAVAAPMELNIEV